MLVSIGLHLSKSVMPTPDGKAPLVTCDLLSLTIPNAVLIAEGTLHS